METSLLIARVLSLCYIAFGLGLIISPKFYKRELPKLVDKPALLIYGGLLATALGYLIIHYHNIWDGSWRVVITVIGWIALVKGVLLLVLPDLYQGFKTNLLHENHVLKVFIPITLIAGLFFGYFGFFYV